jgi:hypothetical protein
MFALSYLYATDTFRKTALSAVSANKRDLAALGFIELLEAIREPLLQDSVHWRLKFPQHYLWRNPVFQSPEYLQWAAYACQETAKHTENVTPELAVVAPMLAEVINTQMSSMKAMMSEGFHQVSLTQTEMARTSLQQRQLLETSHLMYKALSQPQNIVIPPLLSFNNATPSSYATVATSSPYQASLYSSAAPVPVTTSPNAVDSFNPHTAQPVLPPFRMDRSITTVVELLKEYRFGWNGKPSVESVYGVKGYMFKQDQTERKFYAGRMVILNFVMKLASTRGTSEETVARVCDEHRSKAKIHSLDKFIRILKEDNNALEMAI